MEELASTALPAVGRRSAQTSTERGSCSALIVHVSCVASMVTQISVGAASKSSEATERSAPPINLLMRVE